MKHFCDHKVPVESNKILPNRLICFYAQLMHRLIYGLRRLLRKNKGVWSMRLQKHENVYGRRKYGVLSAVLSWFWQACKLHLQLCRCFMPPVLPLQLCICCIVGPSHKTRQTPLSWEKLQRVDLLKLEVLITATPTKLPFEAALSCLAAILILFLSFVRSLEAECKH